MLRHRCDIQLLTEMLLEQQNAHNSLVQCLTERIGTLEDTEEDLRETRYVFWTFVETLPEAEIIRLVEFMYQEMPKTAAKAVKWLHDETFDLSKIPCAQKDFEPWPET